MRSSWLVFATTCALLLGAGPGARGDDDAFEAFLAAKRTLSTAVACPDPALKTTTDRADEESPPEVPLGEDTGPAAGPLARAISAGAPDLQVLSPPPQFRVYGVVGSRGLLQAIVDAEQAGRSRLATGDRVSGSDWKVSRITLGEIELVHPTRDPVLLPVVPE